MKTYVTILISLAVGALIGLALAESPERHINKMIQAGFTVIDPEGFAIDRFDE